MNLGNPHSRLYVKIDRAGHGKTGGSTIKDAFQSQLCRISKQKKRIEEETNIYVSSVRVKWCKMVFKY